MITAGFSGSGIGMVAAASGTRVFCAGFSEEEYVRMAGGAGTAVSAVWATMRRAGTG